MTAIRKLFLDDENFESLSTSGSNNNLIYLSALPYMATHTGVVSGLQEVTLSGVVKSEAAEADLDNLASVGKYAVTASTNQVVFIVAKTVTTEAAAKDYIRGMLITYDMKTLSYTSPSTELFVMETRTSNGTLINVTSPISLTTVSSKISCLDGDVNLNNEAGYLIHTINRGLSAT